MALKNFARIIKTKHGDVLLKKVFGNDDATHVLVIEVITDNGLYIIKEILKTDNDNDAQSNFAMYSKEDAEALISDVDDIDEPRLIA